MREKEGWRGGPGDVGSNHFEARGPISSHIAESIILIDHYIIFIVKSRNENSKTKRKSCTAPECIMTIDHPGSHFCAILHLNQQDNCQL